MRRHLRRAALVAVGALLVSGCEFDGAYDLPLPGSPVGEDDSFEVTAEFEDILNVVPRSPIFVNDVTVGEVIEVERVGWNAKITMRVRDDVVLPDNAIAEIRQVSLLGEKYVALEAPEVGARGQLGDGDTIPLAATGRNPEVEEVLGALSFLLSGGGVGQLGTITAELNNALSGREPDLKRLLGSLDDVIGTLDDQRGDILNALESLNSLTATLNREKEVVTGALDVAGPAVEVLAEQEQELVAMLGSLDRLGVVGTRVIRASKDDLLDTLRSLRPVLNRLSASGDALAPGLNLLVSFPFPKEAAEIVKGDYANASIRADISLENILPQNVLDALTLPDLGLPDLPLPDLPGALNQVTKCLRSGNVTGAECTKVLGSLSLLSQLSTTCDTKKNRGNRVCRGIGGVLGGTNGAPDLSLPGLLGLGRLTSALSTGAGAAGAPRTTQQLFGGVS